MEKNSYHSDKYIFYCFLISLLFLLFLAGCHNKPLGCTKSAQQKKLSDCILPPDFSVPHFQSLIKKGHFKKASIYVNSALSNNIRNPALHILNGLVYERLYQLDPHMNRDLPYIAYRTAKTLDPSLSLAHHFLGQAAMQKKDYQEAQDHFVNAVIIKKDFESFYGLACASYAICDMATAKIAVDSGLRICPENEKMLRVGIIVYSALNQIDKAKSLLTQYRKVTGEKSQTLSEKVLTWDNAYKDMRFCNVATDASQKETIKDKDDGQNVIKKKKDPSVVIDAHLAFYDTFYTEQKGTNILGDASNPLMLTLEGAGGQSGVDSTSDGGNKSWTQNMHYTITMGAIRYSMNIANLRKDILEVYYRPSIETTLNKPSSLFSGTMVNAAPQGGQVVKLDLGEHIDVVVKDVGDDGTIQMDLSLSLSELKEAPSRYKSLDEQTLSINQMKIKTTLHSPSGKTVSVGGVTREKISSQKSGIPFLESLPFVQYFTSSQRSERSKVKVCCFVTPRIVGEEVVCKPKFSKELSYNFRKLIKHGVQSNESSDQISDLMKHLRSSVLLFNYRSDDVVYRPPQERSVSILENLNRLKTFLYF